MSTFLAKTYPIRCLLLEKIVQFCSFCVFGEANDAFKMNFPSLFFVKEYVNVLSISRTFSSAFFSFCRKENILLFVLPESSYIFFSVYVKVSQVPFFRKKRGKRNITIPLDSLFQTRSIFPIFRLSSVRDKKTRIVLRLALLELCSFFCFRQNLSWEAKHRNT